MGIDWDKLWTIVSAISSALSAVAAALAVRLVVTQNRENERIRRLQKREHYYESWVSTPINEGVRSFRTKVLDLARSFSRDAEPYRLMSTQQLYIAKAVGILVNDINAEYYQLQAVVLGGAEAWKDEELRNRLRDALEMLQDEATKAAEDLLSNPGDNLSAVLERSCAPILRLVLEGDPGASE